MGYSIVSNTINMIVLQDMISGILLMSGPLQMARRILMFMRHFGPLHEAAPLLAFLKRSPAILQTSSDRGSDGRSYTQGILDSTLKSDPNCGSLYGAYMHIEQG